MKDVSFGQYYPAKSFVHNMDARVKILAVIAYIVAVFLVQSVTTAQGVAFQFLGFGACLLFVLIATLCARVPFGKVLKSIKGIMFFIVLSAILQIFFNASGNVLVKWSFITITDVGLLNAGFLVARISLIVLGASLLTLTTSPVEIADGIESLMYPLKFIKFPVHEFALIMSIALRFIPTLLDETDRIIKAQKARGADFDSGNILKRVKALMPVLIPLLISSFRRADELADAMDSRCYSGSKVRTKYKKMRLTWRDLVATVAIAGLICGVVALNVTGFLAVVVLL
ncbi:MAG: energy-coupling factor transporter transmembrane protein EcfT [Clostridia bacterium]|nr:energy-coupling factor transporter transmembrane protein EcfT [Clostridia bacterium]